MTSLTRTETARMPSGMTGGSPAPASLAASFDGSSGSPLTTETIMPRPTTSSGRANEPSGAWPSGKLSTFTWSGLSSEPSGMSTAATTTGCVGIFAVAGAGVCIML